MEPFLGDVYGNPSSVHHVGVAARASVDAAREKLAAMLQCRPTELVFTSGGTESNNLAILGVARALRDKGNHLVTSQLEHHAVLECFRYLEKKEGFQVTYLPADREIGVSPSCVLKNINSNTILVSTMAANSETGLVFPVQEIGRICRERGVLFHTDAVQWFGKLNCHAITDFNADLVSLCAHKLHGPKGIGALYVRSGIPLTPLMMGGGQEGEKRPGTENVSGIIGLVKAFELFAHPPVFQTKGIPSMTGILLDKISQIPQIKALKSSIILPNTASFIVNDITSDVLLAALDLEGICASSGSACSSGSLTPSHVLLALGYTPEEAKSLLRFSLGRETTLDQVHKVVQVFPSLIERARQAQ